MNTRHIIIGVLAVLLIGIGLSIFSGRSTSDAPVTSDTKAGALDEALDEVPVFSFADYSGNDVSINDFGDSYKILNSWALWCPFCKAELEDFATLQAEFADELSVVAINRGESSQRAQAFTDSIVGGEGIAFLLDPQDTFYTTMLGGIGMPETLFVTPDNTIHFHKRGPMNAAEIRERFLAMKADTR
jgi:thiol-disulfide isomerase/thioredoxin